VPQPIDANASSFLPSLSPGAPCEEDMAAVLEDARRLNNSRHRIPNRPDRRAAVAEQANEHRMAAYRARSAGMVDVSSEHECAASEYTHATGSLAFADFHAILAEVLAEHAAEGWGFGHLCLRRFGATQTKRN
jgi:hypothetical protein